MKSSIERKRFLIATGNAGKLAEFREMPGADRFDWIGLKDVPGLAEVDETGSTFRANAVLKASGYAAAAGMWAMADDSGLEVDALGGSPGVFSARWSAMHNTGSGDAANNRLLLNQLRDVPDDRRSARFVCVLAVADPAGRILFTTRDTVEGRIGRVGVGTNGFGYDPLFVVDGTGRTSAEMSAAEKHAVSHRGRALRQLSVLLDRHLG